MVMLDFITSVDGNDALCHVEVFATLQAGVFHHFFQFILFRMHADGFCKVTIAVFIFGDNFAYLGQQLE